MGYMHVENLAKNQDVLIFKEVYALLKIHGTSAHISYKVDRNPKLAFFSGGEKHDNFVNLFDQEALLAGFEDMGREEVVVFGEAYGGKQQGMSHTYGKDLKFIVFEVKSGDFWLDVPRAAGVAHKLGLEFVPYEKGPATVEWLNSQRDLPDRIAQKLGLGDKPAEGIVIRPLIELRKPNGDRIIAKHKSSAFSERASKADTEVKPEKAQALTAAQAIADEWVTPMRLQHVLQKLPQNVDVKDIPTIIAAMHEDVLREAGDEIVVTKESLKAIGTAAVKLFKKHIEERLNHPPYV